MLKDSFLELLEQVATIRDSIPGLVEIIECCRHIEPILQQCEELDRHYARSCWQGMCPGQTAI